MLGLYRDSFTLLTLLSLSCEGAVVVEDGDEKEGFEET